VNKTVLLVLIGRAFQVVISLAAVRIYTRLLSTGEVGNLFLINSIVGLFALTLINPIGMFINRRLHEWAENKAIINVFFIFNLYLVFISISSVLIVGLLNKFLGVGSTIDIRMLSLFVMLNIYFNTWNQSIIPSLNMLHHVKSFVLLTVATLVLGLGFSVALVTSRNATALNWLSGQVVAQLAITGLAFLYFKKVTKSEFDFDQVRKSVSLRNLSTIAAFALPLALTTFLMWVQNQSYRMVVEKYLGLEFLGMIGVGMGIATSLCATVESLVLQVYYPIYYSEINTPDPVKRALAWNKMARLTIPIYISVTILVSCLAPFLVKILVNDKFSQVYVYVIFGAWVELFRMTTNVLSSVAHSEMQTRSLIFAYLAGALFAFPGVYLCATHGFQQAIPVVLVVSGFVTMSAMYVAMSKLISLKLDAGMLVKPVFSSIPFAFSLLLYSRSGSLLVSVASMVLAGLYFSFMHYPAYRNIRN